MIKHTIEKFNLIEKNDKIVVAVSGGPDSVALWQLLRQIKDKYNLQIHLAHLNHKLRGEESEGDAAFVQELAQKSNEPYTIESRDVAAYAKENKLSTHEAARKLRYDFLYQVAEKKCAAKIAIAHNADDQAETVLMRLLRGSGTAGLRAIEPQSGKIIRPLLETTRREIMEFIKKENLSYRTDSSNLKTKYLRNKIRLELLPLLTREYNPNLRENLVHLADILREEELFWDEYLPAQLEKVLIIKNAGSIILDIARLKELSPAVSSRLIRMAINEVKGDLQALNYTHIQQIRDMIREERGEKHLALPDQLEVIKSYSRLEIRKIELPCPIVNQEFTLTVPGITCVKELNITIEAQVLPMLEISRNNYENAASNICYLDFDKINQPLIIRTRKNGDRFTPFGMSGDKKLKEFFIDKKIPQHLRDRIPLLAAGEEIIWVMGIRCGERAKITSTTRHVMYLTVS